MHSQQSLAAQRNTSHAQRNTAWPLTAKTLLRCKHIRGTGCPNEEGGPSSLPPSEIDTPPR